MTEDDDDAGEQAEEGYIVEFLTLGKAIKVTAFDPVSLREVSIIGAKRTPSHYLSALAIRKLEYVLRKEKDKDKDKAG